MKDVFDSELASRMSRSASCPFGRPRRVGRRHQCAEGVLRERRAGAGGAYVVILHLSPDHDSRLAEVLQTTRRCR